MPNEEDSDKGPCPEAASYYPHTMLMRKFALACNVSIDRAEEIQEWEPLRFNEYLAGILAEEEARPALEKWAAQQEKNRIQSQTP